MVELVERAAQGDPDAFAALAQRFRGMAIGYAWELLGDRALAEDAAQEALLEAWRALPRLRIPAAFPAFLRRIVFKHCDRMRRRKVHPAAPLESVPEPASPRAEADRSLEERERLGAVHAALANLPAPLRCPAVLHYVADASLAEIGEFLGVPTTTVKNRLHAARERLRTEIPNRTARASLHSPAAEQRLARLLDAAEQGDASGVHDLLAHDASLARASGQRAYWVGAVSPLHVAAAHDQDEVVRELLAGGADPMAELSGWTALQMALERGHERVADTLLAATRHVDVFTAVQLGDGTRLRAELAEDPTVVHRRGPDGCTPLHVCYEPELARALLGAGADVHAIDDFHAATPLEWEWNGRRREVVPLLLESGAEVRDIFSASALGLIEHVTAFLAEDAARASEGAPPGHLHGAGTTPRSIAAAQGHSAVVRLLEGRS